METSETMTIGQLAEAAGVNLETVRDAERRGLLAEPPRTPAGYRHYGPGELWHLRLIGRAKRLGFTLAEIPGDGLVEGGAGEGGEGGGPRAVRSLRRRRLAGGVKPGSPKTARA